MFEGEEGENLLSELSLLTQWLGLDQPGFDDLSTEHSSSEFRFVGNDVSVLGLGKLPLTNGSFWKLTELSVNERKEPLIFNSLTNNFNEQRLSMGNINSKNLENYELFLTLNNSMAHKK